jgi:hypothetical protein
MIEVSFNWNYFGARAFLGLGVILALILGGCSPQPRVPEARDKALEALSLASERVHSEVFRHRERVGGRGPIIGPTLKTLQRRARVDFSWVGPSQEGVKLIASAMGWNFTLEGGAGGAQARIGEGMAPRETFKTMDQLIFGLNQGLAAQGEEVRVDSITKTLILGRRRP